jgi:hypothetical protein
MRIAVSVLAMMFMARAVAAQGIDDNTVRLLRGALVDVRAESAAVTRRDWRRRAPDATWRQYRGSPDDLEADLRIAPEGVWCAAATSHHGGVEREAVFYTFRETKPSDCTLEEVAFTFDVPDHGDALERVLVIELGPPGRIDASPAADDAPIRSDFRATDSWSRTGYVWRVIRFWRVRTARVYLYEQEGHVRVLIRSELLRRSLATEAEGANLQNLRLYGDHRTEWRAYDRMKARFSGFAELGAC